MVGRQQWRPRSPVKGAIGRRRPLRVGISRGVPACPKSRSPHESGRDTGSSSTRRLRAQGKIPGVVYGHGADPMPVAVGAREFQIAMSGEAGLNTLLSLEVDGKNFLTLARDIQHHPFKNVVTHVDFLIVRRDEVITAEVPINLVGEAIEVQHGDGVVDQQLFTLHVKAKPADIPPSVDIDISRPDHRGSLHVSDITIPAGRRARDRSRGHRGGRATAAGADHRRGGGRSGRRRGRRGRRRGRRRSTRPTPSPRRTRPCSATGARRRAPEGEPRSISWWSDWAIPGIEFAGTRHNVGAEVAATLVDRHGGRLKPEKGLHARGRARSGSAGAG